MQRVCRWDSRWEVAGLTVNCVQPQPWQVRVMKLNKVQTGGKAMLRGTWTIITTAA